MKLNHCNETIKYTLHDTRTGDCLSRYLCGDRAGQPCEYLGGTEVERAIRAVAVAECVEECFIEKRRVG